MGSFRYKSRPGIPKEPCALPGPSWNLVGKELFSRSVVGQNLFSRSGSGQRSLFSRSGATALGLSSSPLRFCSLVVE